MKPLSLLTLRSHHGFRIGQSSQGLVSLGGQQQTFEIAAKSLTPGQSVEEVVEASSVKFERTGSGLGGQTFGHDSISSLLSLEHEGHPSSTNYR